jgi:hypothetical protein
MNRNTFRLGYFSTWGIIILTAILIICILLQFIIVPDRGWVDCKTSYYTIDTSHSFLSDFCGVVYLLQTPLILILFACLHDYASSSQKIFSGISLSLIIIFTALRTLSYLALFTIDHFNFHAGGDECQMYYTYKLFQNFADNVYAISVTVFPGLAELFIIPVFSRTNKIEKKLRLFMLITGITNLIGALMFVLDISVISNICGLLDLILFTIILAVLIKFFRQIMPREAQG